MKKIFFAIVALIMSINVNAFEFDGIDLNASVTDITRQISAKGYTFDEEKNCLKGMCQGTEIYVAFNYVDVKEKGKIGQLIVDVPMAESNAIDIVTKTFNVVYHLTSSEAGKYYYAASNDGTVLVVSKTKDGIRLTYNTPYYKK